MFSLSRHAITIGRILVALFLLANSGYTLTLHECMKQQMSCCAARASDTQRGPASSTAVKSPLPACCETQVVGGLNDHLVSAAQTVSVESHKQLHAVQIEFQSAGHTVTVNSTIEHLLTTLPDPAPHQAEQYLLNSTLLI